MVLYNAFKLAGESLTSQNATKDAYKTLIPASIQNISIIIYAK